MSPGGRRAPTPPWRLQVAPAAVGRIPLFGQDVHDLGGLQRAADFLFG